MGWKKTLITVLLSGASLVAIHDLGPISKINKNNKEIEHIRYFLSNYGVGMSDTFPYSVVGKANSLEQENKKLKEHTWVYRIII